MFWYFKRSLNVEFNSQWWIKRIYRIKCSSEWNCRCSFILVRTKIKISNVIFDRTKLFCCTRIKYKPQQPMQLHHLHVYLENKNNHIDQKVQSKWTTCNSFVWWRQVCKRWWQWNWIRPIFELFSVISNCCCLKSRFSSSFVKHDLRGVLNFIWRERTGVDKQVNLLMMKMRRFFTKMLPDDRA